MHHSLTPDVFVLLVGAALDAQLLRELRHLRWLSGWRGSSLLGLRTLWLMASLDLGVAGLLHFDSWLPFSAWVRAAGVAWIVFAASAWLTLRVFRNTAAPVNSARRRLLRTAAMAATGVPIAASAFGILKAQSDVRVRELDLPLSGLHPDLEGRRIVHLSDIHLSPFVSRAQLARAVDQANELRADLAVVTGDLISSPGDPLDDCIDELRRLKSPNGIWGCLGNHEIVAGAEDYATARGARCGIRFLRSRSVVLPFGAGRLNVAGVDYQRKGSVYLAGAGALRRDGATNLLLCHNPDPFPVASSHGWDAVLAGHTHGGQITLEYLHPNLNPARFYTPFVYGLYRRGATAMYVTSGIGTVGLPARLGTSPEIVLARLRSV